MSRPTKKLYGLDDEQARLFQCYERAILSKSSSSGIRRRSRSTKQEIVLLSGKSGVGKTSLALTLENAVAAEGGFLLIGKFDLAFTDPFAVLFDIAAQFVDLVSEEQPGRIPALRKALLEKLGEDAQLLVDTIPVLSRFMKSGTGGGGVTEHSMLRSKHDELAKTLVGSGGFSDMSSGNFSRIATPATATCTTYPASNTMMRRRSSPASTWGVLSKSRTSSFRIQQRMSSSFSFKTAATSPPSSSLTSPNFKIGNKKSQKPETRSRFNKVFCKFVKEITKLIPLVVVLDDLHWGDASSMELTRLICQSMEGERLLIVGIHREIRKRETRPFADVIYDLEEEPRVALTHIDLASLDFDHVNEFISDVLQSGEDETEDLSELIFNVTAGNVYFANEILSFLNDQELLVCNENSNGGEFRWTWDIDSIQQGLGAMGNELIDMLFEKMKKLPVEIQFTLKIAACMGRAIDDQTLSLVLGGKAVMDDLELAREAGFVTFNPTTGGYNFCHDKIQKAALMLIPEELKTAIYLDIGRKIWLRSTQTGLLDNIFLVVALLYNSIDLVERRRELYDIARLHLIAGEKAASLWAFPESAEYFNRGIDILRMVGDHHWMDEYKLTVLLYDSAAEAEVLVCNHERVQHLVETLLLNARCIGDKLRPYRTLIDSLGQQEEFEECQEVFLNVLAELDYSIPKPTKLNLVKELMQTRRVLRGKTTKELMKLLPMQDEKRLTILDYFLRAFPYLYLMRSRYASIVGLRCVRYSVNHGRAPGAALGFAIYSMTLGSMLGEAEEAYSMGQVAMALLKKDRSSMEHLPAITCFLHMCSFTFSNPIKDSYEPLKLAINKSIECRSQIWLGANVAVYFFNCLMHGMPLSIVVPEQERYEDYMIESKQDAAFALTRPMFQYVDNLLGEHVDDLSILAGDKYDPEALDQNYKNNLSVVLLHLQFATKIAYLYNDFERAKVCSDEYIGIDFQHKALYPYVDVIWYNGLACAALAKRCQSKSDRRNLYKRAKAQHAKLTRKAQHATANFGYKALLLQAELLSVTDKESEKIVDLYADAAAGAEKEEFINDAALIYERAAAYRKEQGEYEESKSLLAQAISLYSMWGATGKVAILEFFWVD